MQIIFDNFKQLSRYETKSHLQDKEICIKNLSDKDERLYARTYTYNGFGCAKIDDRLLPIGLKAEIINNKHKLTIYNLEK